MMGKICTKHIRERPIEQQAQLASQYYIRARKAERELEELRSQYKELDASHSRICGAIANLMEEAGIEND